MTDKKKMPETLEEAVTQILDGMSEKDKKTVRETKEEDLINFHFGWGQGIRNGFGLWNHDSPLLKNIGCELPDDASGIIIKAVWEKLNSE